MVLDPVAQRYAHTLFVDKSEELTRKYVTKRAEIVAGLARRGMLPHTAGHYHSEVTRLAIQHVEEIADAKVDALLEAHKRANIPIDDQAVADVHHEIVQFCEAQERNLTANAREQTGRAGMPQGVAEQLVSDIARGMSGIPARIHRKLSAKRDEEIMAARAPAKSLLRQQPRQKAFRWDITLALGVAILAVVIVFVPPQSERAAAFWLCAMFGLGVYPILHISEWLHRRKSSWMMRGFTIAAWAATMVIFGVNTWPPVRRHPLSARERFKFEAPLSQQKENKEEIQLTCPQDDESVCVYAGQFVNYFREAGWKVHDSKVQRITMSTPVAGIVLFQHGVGKLNPDDWRSGLWTAISLSFVNVRQAFVNIGIQPEAGANPDLPEGLITVYFGPPRENEGAPTQLSLSMDNMEKLWREGRVPRPTK